MDSGGAWGLTPAYDMTFAKGQGWTRTHQMLLAGKAEGVTLDDLIGVAEAFGIRAADKLIQHQLSVVDRWADVARRYGVDEDTIDQVQTELDARRRQLLV